MKMLLSRDRSRRSGNGAIEFAIGFSVLFACFSGVFQYGYSMWMYNALENAVSDGAAYASRANICATDTSFSDQIKALVVYGDPNATSGPTRVPGLTTGRVSVVATPAAFPKTVTVRISDFTVDAMFQSFTFANKPAVTTVYLANYMPGGC
jgi:Flp pilus assembly protein TadG